jgi:hypothetical protein
VRAERLLEAAGTSAAAASAAAAHAALAVYYQMTGREDDRKDEKDISG